MEQKSKDYINFLLNEPYKFGHLVGFDKLTMLHNQWIIEMLTGTEDDTLQAHRGSYKTTCVSIALALIIILLPNKTVLFQRKTDTDTKEIVLQIKKILLNPKTQHLINTIYGKRLKLMVDNQNEINTNLVNSPRGMSQLVAMGIGTSITGKHFDFIFTDDIVNKSDRYSKAVREDTRRTYQELHNIVNPGGRIFNSGTPWHKDDCFTLMPKPRKFDCYSTNLLSKEKLDDLKKDMSASLFSANYELKHISDDNVLFKTYPALFVDRKYIENSIAHIDAAYGGTDECAFSIMKRVEDKYYCYGDVYTGHIDEVLDRWLGVCKEYKIGTIHCEDNADKGYLRKEIIRKGFRCNGYHESMNKYVKISTYLKGIWEDIFFYELTNKDYISKILDYNELAEHDDCADSCSSVARLHYKKKRRSLLDV